MLKSFIFFRHTYYYQKNFQAKPFNRWKTLVRTALFTLNLMFTTRAMTLTQERFQYLAFQFASFHSIFRDTVQLRLLVNAI